MRTGLNQKCLQGRVGAGGFIKGSLVEKYGKCTGDDNVLSVECAKK